MLYFFKINYFFSKALLDSSVSLSKTVLFTATRFGAYLFTC